MTASQETEVSQLARELREAREQLTTTGEILEVIRNSLNDTQPVFDAIVQSGVRLFPGAAVSIAPVENGLVKAAAVAERDPGRAELWRQRAFLDRAEAIAHGGKVADNTRHLQGLSWIGSELASGAPAPRALLDVWFRSLQMPAGAECARWSEQRPSYRRQLVDPDRERRLSPFAPHGSSA
jgi:hypothetical protein